MPAPSIWRRARLVAVGHHSCHAVEGWLHTRDQSPNWGSRCCCRHSGSTADIQCADALPLRGPPPPWVRSRILQAVQHQRPEAVVGHGEIRIFGAHTSTFDRNTDRNTDRNAPAKRPGSRPNFSNRKQPIVVAIKGLVRRPTPVPERQGDSQSLGG